jgi:hypothetical protein
MPVYHVSCPSSDESGNYFRAKNKHEALKRYKKALTDNGNDEVMVNIWPQVAEDIVIERIVVE